jgi:hypothetical protein
VGTRTGTGERLVRQGGYQVQGKQGVTVGGFVVCGVCGVCAGVDDCTT